MKRLDLLKSRFAAAGIRPNPRLGQNFLLDANQVRFIARQGEVGPDDLVLEVGPGTGFLTREMLAAGAEVVAVEYDNKLHEYVARELSGAPGFHILHGDILAGKNAINPRATDLLRRRLAERAAAGAPARLKCVSNLPYSAGTPLAMNLFSSGLPWERAVFLIQWEVAERMTATAGTPSYGGLSITMALGGRAKIVRKVPPPVFWPRPRVDSAVVQVEFLPPAARLALPWSALRAVTSASFRARRKRLANAFKGVLPRETVEEWLAGHGLDAETRGETLTPAQFLSLAGLWAARPEDA